MSAKYPAVAAAVVAACLAPFAQAQVYKCIDGGRTVYSQIPCPANAKSTTISRTAPSGPAPGTDESGKAAPGTAAEQEQAFRKRLQAGQEAQKKETAKLEAEKEKQENCNTARSQLAQYEIGGRISRTSPRGERYFLDDQQIDQEKARARSLVDQWCK